MPEYAIERWDSVIPSGATFPFPMIYIKGDKTLVDFAKKTNYVVVVTIKNSGSLYDKSRLVGVMDCSGTFPNFRPNFFNETQYYVITLSSDWLGYPPNLGTVAIESEEEAIETIKPRPFTPPKPIPYIEWYPTLKPSLKIGSKIYLIIVVIILLLLCMYVARTW